MFAPIDLHLAGEHRLRPVENPRHELTGLTGVVINRLEQDKFMHNE